MSPARVSDRLAAVVETLDWIASWLDGDGADDVRVVAGNLHSLRLEIERAEFAARVPT